MQCEPRGRPFAAVLIGLKDGRAASAAAGHRAPSHGTKICRAEKDAPRTTAAKLTKTHARARSAAGCQKPPSVPEKCSSENCTDLDLCTVEKVSDIHPTFPLGLQFSDPKHAVPARD